MKVLLIEDVYKLGRAGEVKSVANGYGRNFLLPQGLAVLATPGALKQAEQIKQAAAARRKVRNEEMQDVAERISDIVLIFPAKASETGKLYGSVTTQMIAESLSEESGIEIERRQIDSQPLRSLGEHKVEVRLTVDLVPEITVVVHREGEAPVMPGEEEEEAEAEAEAGTGAEAGEEEMPEVQAVGEVEAETDAEEVVESDPEAAEE